MEQVVAQMTQEKQANADRVADLNHQVEALTAKTGQIEAFDQLAAHKVGSPCSHALQ